MIVSYNCSFLLTKASAMKTQKTPFTDILFTSSHLFAPFKYQKELKEGLVVTQRLSTATKTVAIAAAILLALPTLGIGSLISLYMFTAISKYRTQQNGNTITKIRTVWTNEFLPKPLVPNQTTFNTHPQNLTGAMQEVPAAGVTVGINNLGNTCWLNSCLKFLATNNSFDSILDCSDADIRLLAGGEDVEKRILLRDHLKFIVNTLRDTSPHRRKFLDPIYVSSLVELMHSQNADFGYTQCDAVEALDFFMQIFGFPHPNNPNQQPQLVTAYHNYEGLLRNSEREALPIITANAANPDIFDEDRKIDLDKCITSPPGMVDRISADGIPGEFLMRRGLTNAPDNLTVHVGRRIGLIKNLSPVKMDDDLRVGISVYREEQGQLVVNEEARYEIAGAIMHEGSGKGGHYTFIEKKGNKFFYHNDSRIAEMTKEEAVELFKLASTFQLKKTV